MPPELDEQIAAAAQRAGMTYSSWLAATAQKEFILRAGLAAVGEYEREHGLFSPEELADADQWADAVSSGSDHRAGPKRKSA